MLNGGDRQHSIKEQMMGAMGDRDQILKMMQMINGDSMDPDREDQMKKMMQMMNGNDRKNSVKQQMMGDRDQMQEMMQIMNDRKREDSIDSDREDQMKKI